MRWRQYTQFSLLVGCLIISTAQGTYALEGLTLVKAGFTTTPEKEAFQKKTGFKVEEIQLETLKERKIFFWTELRCTPECQKRLRPENFIVLHRLVRQYGTKVVTVQVREISLKELLEQENVVRTEQEIRAVGIWFAEVRTSDGQKLCLKPNQPEQPDICKFEVRFK